MRQGPPLPIPNREVKPARADDTAIPGGKVGRRQDYNQAFNCLAIEGFFFAFLSYSTILIPPYNSLEVMFGADVLTIDSRI